jgi:hypothetical protein
MPDLADAGFEASIGDMLSDLRRNEKKSFSHSKPAPIENFM